MTASLRLPAQRLRSSLPEVWAVVTLDNANRKIGLNQAKSAQQSTRPQ